MKLDEVNILMLGAANVGKSALTVRFLTKRFIGDYKSEGDSIYTHTVDFGEERCNVSVLDTCSKTGGSRNLSEQIRWADVVALVYDVSNTESLDKVRDQLRQLNRKPPSLPTVVLCNKVDLNPKAHVVDPQEARQLAEEYGCQFSEVSAADDWLGVSRAFKGVIRLAESRGKRRRSPMILRKRRGSVTRQVAHKVMQVVSWSPKRT